MSIPSNGKNLEYRTLPSCPLRSDRICNIHCSLETIREKCTVLVITYSFVSYENVVNWSTLLRKEV